MVLVCLVFFGFLTLIGEQAGRAPKLAADCTTPKLKLETTKPKLGSLLTFSVAGPADRRYVVALDAAALSPKPGGGYDVRPKPGADPAQVIVSSAITTTKCLGSGRIGLPVDAGEHTITLFDVSDATAAATVVTAIPITVTALH